jgi:uncharacterized protein YegP (UPF0339 family)
MGVKYEIRRATGVQPFYARAVSNGNVLMHSETYYNKTDAVNVANVMKGPGDTVVDLT